MFNEGTINNMEIIDYIVSEKNKELKKNKSNLFLSWTFPTNYIRKENMATNDYFAVWIGESGKGLLKIACFGQVGIIDELLSKASETELRDLLNVQIV